MLKLATTLWPPLMLAYSATILKEQGIDAKIIDANALRMPFKKLKDELTKYDSCVITTNQYDRWGAPLPTCKAALDVSRYAKDSLKIKTVLIGPHPTIYPQKYSEYADSIIAGWPEFKIVGALLNEKKIVSSAPFDLNKLPLPSLENLPLENYYSPVHKKPFFIWEVSRGCSFNCNYCFLPIAFGNHVRYKTPKKVIDELKFLTEWGITDLRFCDANFTQRPVYIEKICEGIKREGINLSWSCQTRTELTDKKCLQKMKTAGCHHISFGIESTTQNVKSKVKREAFIEDFRKSVFLVKESGINVAINFLVGLPMQSKEDIQKDINFASSLRLNYLSKDMVNCTLTVPYPKTSLWELGKKEGKIKEDDWDECGKNAGTIDNKITLNDLKRFRDEFTLIAKSKRYNIPYPLTKFFSHIVDILFEKGWKKAVRRLRF